MSCNKKTSTNETTMNPAEEEKGKTSLREASRSPLFRALQSGGLPDDGHAGNRVLYKKQPQIKALLN